MDDNASVFLKTYAPDVCGLKHRLTRFIEVKLLSSVNRV